LLRHTLLNLWGYATGHGGTFKVGDRVRVIGRWVIDHHPEFCSNPESFTPPEPSRCRNRGWLRVGQTHAELHPFQWDNIQLVEPVTSADVVSATVSLAAPLHEEQYLGGWKWFANEFAGVAGKVFLEESNDPNFPNFSKNYHTSVGARVQLDPPPRPAGADWRLVWSESVSKLGQGMRLADVRTVTQRTDGGIIIQVTIFAKGPNGGLASIHDPANDRSVFQARYELQWTNAKPTPIPDPTPVPADDRAACLRGCTDERNGCMAQVARKGGPRPQQCVNQFNACQKRCK
jgi:hypothetical protein